MKILAAAIISILATMGSHTLAEAQCVGPNAWNGTMVRLYVNTTTGQGVQRLGFTVAQAEALTRRAAAIFSEESGTNFRVEYSGTTSDYTKTGAIVVSTTDVQDPDSAIAISHVTSTSNVIDYVAIEFHRYTSGGTLRNWQYTVDASTGSGGANVNPEYVSVLLHELGHAVADLRHPGETPCSDTGQVTMMRPFGTYTASQGLMRLDKVNLASKYGARSATTVLSRRDWSGSSWGSLTTVAFNGIVYRAANLTTNYPYTGFVFEAASLAGLVSYKTLYSGSFSDDEVVDASDWRSTSSVAIDNINFGAILVYQKDSDGDDLDYDICYRLSLDGGQTFSPTETCAFSNTRRPRLTSTFDPYRKVYIISWIENTGKLTFYTVPAPGSSQTSNQWSQWSSGDDAWFGPSVACRNAANGCRVAYSDRAAGSCFKWVEAGVNSSGQMIAGTVRSNCYHMTDSPSVVYDNKDSRFYRAFTQNNGATYFAWMSSTGTSWTGAADMYNVNAFHTGQLAGDYFCFFGCYGGLHGWLIRY